VNLTNTSVNSDTIGISAFRKELHGYIHFVSFAPSLIFATKKQINAVLLEAFTL